MTSRFMISVATAALIAGTSFAYAQGTGHEAGPAAGAPAAEHGTAAAPAGHEAAKPTAPSSGMKATQSEQKAPAAAQNQRAEEGQKPGGMRPENNNASGGKDMKAEGRDNNAEGRDNKMNADSKGAAENKQTTGQAAAGGKLSGEQRTKISSVIRGTHVAPVTNVNFAISVGTRVPRDVEFHQLPAEVITYYPEWRGYEFIMVNNQILVIDPATFEIVAVLDA
jgi:hypothetical protein